MTLKSATNQLVSAIAELCKIGNTPAHHDNKSFLHRAFEDYNEAVVREAKKNTKESD